MMRAALAYVAALVVMGALDFVWLSTTVPALYRPKLGPLLAEQPRMGIAVLFYLLYRIGVVLLAVQPAAGQWRQALWLGAMLGLIAYGTYDLTNHATLRGWPWVITVVDMAWGVVLTAVVAAIATWLTAGRG